MSVSTVFLQTTEDDRNQYGDTTFNIELPMLQPSYKLSLATFMFRPKMVLGENEYITLELDVQRDVNHPIEFPHNYEWLNTGKVTRRINFGPLEFDPSMDAEHLKQMFAQKLSGELTHESRVWTQTDNPTDANWIFHPSIPDEVWTYRVTKTTIYTWNASVYFIPTSDNHLTFVFDKALTWTDSDPCYWILSSVKVLDISPALSRLTGITGDETFKTELVPIKKDDNKTYNLNCLTAKTTNIFRPQYWNYITLTCNKVYNTTSIVNQEYYNQSPSESTAFYKNQILGYMVNTCASPMYICTGMATANEYLIIPSDFNSIRFTLHYDNGDPVRLYSPMTIVLNISSV